MFFPNIFYPKEAVKEEALNPPFWPEQACGCLFSSPSAFRSLSFLCSFLQITRGVISEPTTREGRGWWCSGMSDTPAKASRPGTEASGLPPHSPSGGAGAGLASSTGAGGGGSERGSPTAGSPISSSIPGSPGNWKYRPSKRTTSFNTRQSIGNQHHGTLSAQSGGGPGGIGGAGGAGIGPGSAGSPLLSSTSAQATLREVGFYREIDTCRKMMKATYVVSFLFFIY